MGNDNDEWVAVISSVFYALSECEKHHLWQSTQISKGTFLDMFKSLPGVLSERLFAAFDVDNNGQISFDEFIMGMTSLHGNPADCVDIIYRICDVNNDGVLTEDEFNMVISTSFNRSSRPPTYQPIEGEELALTNLKVAVQQRTELKKVISHFAHTICSAAGLNQSELFGGNKEGVVYISRGLPLFNWYAQRYAILKNHYLMIYKSPCESDTIYLTPNSIATSSGTHKCRRVDLIDFKCVLSRTDASGNRPGRLDQLHGISLSVPRRRGPPLKAQLFFETESQRNSWIATLNDIATEQTRELAMKYNIENIIGYGQYSVVFKGHCKATGNEVAVKIVRKNADDEALVHTPDRVGKRQDTCGLCGCCRYVGNRLNPRRRKHALSYYDIYHSYALDSGVKLTKLFSRKEVAILKLLDHKNVVKLLDIYSVPDKIYLVMDHLQAGDLRRILDTILVANRVIANEGMSVLGVSRLWVPEDMVKCISHDILRGLEYLHERTRNIIHRDIKPENIMLSVDIHRLNDLFCSVISDSKTSGELPTSGDRDMMVRVPLLGELPTDVNIPQGNQESSVFSSNTWIVLYLFFNLLTRRVSPINEEVKKLLIDIPPVPSNVEEISKIFSTLLEPRICDFGLSTIIAPNESNIRQLRKDVNPNVIQSKAYSRTGTVAYAAPEVLHGNGYTTKADIWSIGVLLYEMLSNGHFPVNDGQPSAMSPSGVAFDNYNDGVLSFKPEGVWNGISHSAQLVVRGALTVNPEDRPTASALLEYEWYK